MAYMKKTVVVDAPGKINLSLDIVGVREDGYHDIHSIMQTVDLYDTITISRSKTDGIFISCNRPQIPCNETNYAHIAARRFFEVLNVEPVGISIDIQKRIPVQAGLAGGSADAAGVLVGLNALLDVGATPQALCEAGASVGADVPFCIIGGTQQAQGIGDKLTRLPDLGDCYIVIAKPHQGISTADSYRKYDRYGAEYHPNIAYLIRQLRLNNLKELASGMYNVLEEVADLEDIHILRNRMIASGAVGSLMSGSGSAVFGIFQNRSQAKHCMRKLYDSAESVFLVSPVPHGAIVLDIRE